MTHNIWCLAAQMLLALSRSQAVQWVLVGNSNPLLRRTTMPAPWAAVAQLRIVGRLHGSVTNNVMHFATNTVVNDPSTINPLLLQLAQAMLLCVRETLLPALTEEWIPTQVEAKLLHPTETDAQIAPFVAEDVGLLGPTSVSFAASLVNLRSGIGGRRGRGKMFLPPPGEPQIATSEMDPATLALIAAFVACVVSKFVGSGASTPWRLGILSRKDLNAAGGTFDNSFREVTSMVPSKVLARCGSRKVGKGA